MCIFTGDVVAVSATNIFGRRESSDRQLLAYSMNLSAVGHLAMVLPLPTPVGAAEDAIRWIDLSGYTRLFDDLNACFASAEISGSFGAQSASRGHTLAVVEVGDFDASFVPSARDFARLDKRFRLKKSAWNQLPEYSDWGFAVFKLRHDAPSFLDKLLRRGRNTYRSYHPMAFSFPTREAQRVFFPTVHVHDGVRHEQAGFDHCLYLQMPEPPAMAGVQWQSATKPVASRVALGRARGVVVDAPCYRMLARGVLPNQDVWADA